MSVRIRISREVFLALSGVLLLITGSARAQEPGAKAVLLRSKVAVGEQATLILQCLNGQPRIVPAEIPAEGLSIVSTGRKEISSFLGSKGPQSEYRFYYLVSGEREGRFVIPAFKVQIGSQACETQPLELDVFVRKPGERALDASKPYFATLEARSGDLFVNQMIPAAISVYVRGVRSINELGPPKLQHEAIVVKRFGNLEQDTVELEGIPFSTATLNGAIYPLSPGKLQVGPTEIDVRMIESGRFGGFGFFQNSTVKTLRSSTLSLNVMPLPEAGRPANFKGAVGDFKISSVNVSPTELNVGDPITVELEITGAGNFDMVEAPVFLPATEENWRVYDAHKIPDPENVSDGESEGKVKFSQIVMPKTAVSEVPSFELAFFDPKSGIYRVEKTPPTQIRVVEDVDRNSAPSVMGVPGGNGGYLATPAAASPTPSFEDILFIRSGTTQWQPSAVPASIFGRPAFWFVQSIPSIALFSVLGVGLTRLYRKRQTERQRRQTEISMSRALSELEDAEGREEHYRHVQIALDAWRNECAAGFGRFPSEVQSAYDALQSRCQWILYGAPDAERLRALSSDEAAENRNILDNLSTHRD